MSHLKNLFLGWKKEKILSCLKNILQVRKLPKVGGVVVVVVVGGQFSYWVENCQGR